MLEPSWFHLWRSFVGIETPTLVTAATSATSSAETSLASVLDVSIDELVYDKKKNSNTDLINELVKLISDCDYEKLMVINDVLRVLVKSLNRNL